MDVIVEYSQQGEGAILVFVPGWDDISKVNKLLTEDNTGYKMTGVGSNTIVYPLHSLMPTVRISFCMVGIQTEIQGLRAPLPSKQWLPIFTNITISTFR